MRVGIIDADLIGRKKHRFPNLACMKLSAWHRAQGDDVELLLDYAAVNDYDKAYVSKAFTDTPVPDWVLKDGRVIVGGTGFYYDAAPPLPDWVEHIMPDYDLYAGWVSGRLAAGASRKELAYYTDYSIGFLTRGCFRKCPFCVNRNSAGCAAHSHVSEFFDPSRPKLCFLDDNFFACPGWRDIISGVIGLGRRFQFKQGLDERLLNEEKVHGMMSWPYDGDYIFAFDNIADRGVIEDRLRLIRMLYPDTKRHFKFYVLCGYDRLGAYSDAFYERDVRDTFERIRILASHGALPYIMRHERHAGFAYSGIYTRIAGWCNQPAIFKKFTFREYCVCKGMGDAGYARYGRDWRSFLADGGQKGVAWRDMEAFEAVFPDIADEYFGAARLDLV